MSEGAQRQESDAVDRERFRSPRLIAGLALTITFIYFLVVIVGITHHEMWVDEFQAWLIARDSTSLANLLGNISAEGSGPLWYLLLLPLTKVTHDPFAMQVLHAIIATACVYVVTRYSTLTWYQKILFPFGYFILFEYAMISRCYVLGNLLLFTFCAVYQRHPKRYFLLFGLLALIATTSVYGVMLAMAFGAGVIAETIFGKERSRGSQTEDSDSSGKERLPASKTRVRMLSGLICFALVLALIVVSLIPQRTGFRNNLPKLVSAKLNFSKPETMRDFTRACGTVLYAYAPIPATTYNFWETSIFRKDFFTLPVPWAVLSFGLFFLFLFALAFFRNSAFVATSYCLGTLGLVAFSFLIHTGAMRHFGQLFTLLVACVWLANASHFANQRNRIQAVEASTQPDETSKQSASNLETHSSRPDELVCHIAHHCFSILLAIQFAVGIYCYAIDYQSPFSQSQEIAKFLKQNDLDKKPICSHSFYGVGVCGLLDRKVYVIDHKTMGSFHRYVKREKIPTPALGEVIRELSQDGSPILVLAPKVLLPAWCPDVNLRLIKAFEGSIVPTEDRYLYSASLRKGAF